MSWQTTRVDANHAAFVKLARQLGGRVCDTHRAGDDAPDLFVHIPPAVGWLAVEIKSGTNKLRPGQAKLAREAPVVVWRTEADVLRAFGVKSA